MLSIKRLDLADARVLIAGAQTKAVEIGVPMCIAVTDESGVLLAFERMDGSKVHSAALAIDKSFTASGTRRPTHEIGEASQPGNPVYGISTALGGRMLVVGGGLPVFVDDDVVGGIGVSSGTPVQDRQVAEAGLRAFAETLNK